MASVVAKLRAADEDEGSNAEMDYRIVDGDGPNMFNITTDEETQDGVIILQKVDPLKQSFQMLEYYSNGVFRHEFEFFLSLTVGFHGHMLGQLLRSTTAVV